MEDLLAHGPGLPDGVFQVQRREAPRLREGIALGEADPFSSWYFRITGSGIGAPPEMKKWTWDRSAPAHSGVSAMSWNMTGTANM